MLAPGGDPRVGGHTHRDADAHPDTDEDAHAVAHRDCDMATAPRAAVAGPDKMRGSATREPLREKIRAKLFADADDYEKFCSRHAAHKVKRADLTTHTGPAYLGIDAGSTTTKLTLINSAGDLLYSDYGSNQGRPLASAVAANLALGKSMAQAVESAIGYVQRALALGVRPGRGEVLVLDHFGAAPRA